MDMGRSARKVRLARRGLDPWKFSLCQILTINAILVMSFLGYCFIEEGSGATLAFAISVSAVIASVFIFISRRLLFSSCATMVIVSSIVGVAVLKRSRDNMTLHSWDLFSFLKEPFSTAGPTELAIGCLVFVMSIFFLVSIYRLEPMSLRSSWNVMFLIGSLVTATICGSVLPERSHTQFFWDDLHLSNFFRSFHETFDALGRGGLVIASGGTDGVAQNAEFICEPTVSPVNIILIHEESVTSPDLFPDLKFDKGLMKFFESDDKKVHQLRVETYGGASWLTQFSVFSGVSTHSYGSIRNFVQIFTAGKLKETLPQVLAACGYRNIMFTPWRKAFMAMVRFYEGIGFGEIADSKVQGNVREDERDHFFFGNALNRIEEHLGNSKQPLFLYIETMSAHGPYDVVYMPEVVVNGGGPGTPPQMSEYLRRLAMVKMDDDWFRLELARRFPKEGFLLVRYGDHHPTATMPLLGEFDAVNAEDTHFPIDSPAFITFFATNGVGYLPPALPSFETVDVPYLGGILLEAARLPIPQSWQKRSQLMETCQGRYWSCPDQATVLEFNRGLISAEIINVQ